MNYIKQTYVPTETLGVRLLLGDNVHTDLKNNEGYTPPAAQKEHYGVSELLLKQKDVDPNFPDNGKFDPPDITWPEFEPAEPPGITWPEFDPPDLSGITWPEFEPAESPELSEVFGKSIILIGLGTSS
jgi:hypothetical protein